MLSTTDQHSRLLDLYEVKSRVSMSRSSIYSLVSRKKFPQPVKIGAATRFLASEIDAWIAAAAAQRSSS